MTTETIDRDLIRQRWETDARPADFGSGRLIDDSGCCCAQGDILRAFCGYSDGQLRQMQQDFADKEIAKRLGISVGHAVLIRNVNDSSDGQPQKALMADRVPEYGAELFGPQHDHIFALFHAIDGVTAEQWLRLAAAWAAARAAAWDAARDAARDAAWAAAWAAAWDAAGDAAAAAARVAARVAARAAARVAARDAAWALVVRDLIGQHGLTQVHYDTLTRPWRTVVGKLHPDDEDMPEASDDDE